MNYSEGVKHMKKLTAQLHNSEKKSETFSVGQLTITYPAGKKYGDYIMRNGNNQPTHADIVGEIHDLTTNENFNDVLAFLEDVYTNGLNATNNTFSKAFKEKIFWITLQEDINYPKGSGRRMPFSRYYEGMLAKIGQTDLEETKRKARVRTYRPRLLNLENGLVKPAFYRW